MGFNPKYLTGVKDLKREFKEMGKKKFVSTYQKYNSFIGSDKALEYLTKKLNKKSK